MKNKKSLFAIIAVLLIAVVGVTFAYFQSTGSFVNIFQTATYRIISTEVFESPDNWLPGDTVEKTIVTTNEGSVEAAVRVSYTEAWYDENDNDITESIEEGSAIINFDNQNEWIKEGNYYYYKYILEPNETTSSFIKSVTLNEDLDDVTCTVQGQSKICESLSPALGVKYIMTITIDTVEYDKYQEAWNTNVEIPASNSNNNSEPVTFDCPGPNCKYTFLYDLTDDMPNDEDVVSNYEEIGHQYFIGLIEGNSNKISKRYTCGILEGTVFCLEPGQYTANVEILNDTFGIENCRQTGNQYICTSNDSDIYGVTSDVSVWTGAPSWSYDMCYIINPERPYGSCFFDQ